MPQQKNSILINEHALNCEPVPLSKRYGPKNFVSRILCCVALVYNSYSFQNSDFTEIIQHWILMQTP